MSSGQWLQGAPKVHSHVYGFMHLFIKITNYSSSRHIPAYKAHEHFRLDAGSNLGLGPGVRGLVTKASPRKDGGSGTGLGEGSLTADLLSLPAVGLGRSHRLSQESALSLHAEEGRPDDRL